MPVFDLSEDRLNIVFERYPPLLPLSLIEIVSAMISQAEQNKITSHLYHRGTTFFSEDHPHRLEQTGLAS